MRASAVGKRDFGKELSSISNIAKIAVDVQARPRVRG